MSERIIRFLNSDLAVLVFGGPMVVTVVVLACLAWAGQPVPQ